MRVPSNILRKKVHKINLYNNTDRGTKIAYGNWGIQSLTPKMVSYQQLEAARKVLNKICRKIGSKVWVRICVNVPVTKKPKEIKLGKGVGKVEGWFSAIRRGTIIYEWNSSQEMAKSIHRLVSDKLGIMTQLNKKYKYLLNE